MALRIFNFDAPRKLPQQPNPNAVRAYLRHVLITKHDATPKFADAVAEQWHLGRTADLYEASAKSLAKLFGPDVGPIIFRSVREDAWADWWNSYQGLVGSGCLAASVTLAACFLIRACRASTLRESRGWLRYFFAAAGPSTLGSILQWPHGPTKLLFLVISMLCTGLGALFGIINLADSYTERHEKTS